MHETRPIYDLIIVGGGPVGIETAVEAQRAQLGCLVLEAGAVGNTMLDIFPPRMHWFSSNDRIAIAGVPIQTTDQQKCTREEYLAYLRQVVTTFNVPVLSYQRVVDVQRDAGGESFIVLAQGHRGRREYQARYVVLATGDTHEPLNLDVPGADLPHVHTRMGEPHQYFGCDLLVVGGKNSAVEAALRCHHAGAKVALSYRRDSFDKRAVKYWLLPELLGRISAGKITCHYRTQVERITQDVVTLRRLDTDQTVDIPVDFVLVQIGFDADMSLFQRIGVELLTDNQIPQHDSRTMMTNVEGVYVVGTATAGRQQSYRVFLENCHIHTQRVVASITGQTPPDAPKANAELET